MNKQFINETEKSLPTIGCESVVWDILSIPIIVDEIPAVKKQIGKIVLYSLDITQKLFFRIAFLIKCHIIKKLDIDGTIIQK
mmetsp:Transcript_8220/g.8220  ORF Transcript_8220/g.8220 Transcript_8220/m.8220 type:complete len:82 (+) Transcript_8220:1004-1249(+)